MTTSSVPDRSLQILVADDARDLQALIAHWLTEAGHTVVSAFSGAEVAAHIERQAFDVVVTDILMPDGNGWDAIGHILRVRPGTRIVAMSGGAREIPANAVLRVARNMGALAVLQKPFSRVEFMAAVSRGK